MVIALSAISQVSAADLNQTDDKLTIDDENILTTTYSPKNYDDLKTAISNASDGDTIELNGTYEFNGVITVTKSINIIGLSDGATIKYDGFSFTKSGYFNVDSSASNVLISNLKFTAYNTGNQGAINWEGSNGNLTNCEFNKFILDDGAILYISGTNINIDNCSFKWNRITGGTINLYGDGSTIKNCEFSYNEAPNENSSGAAILLRANDCIVENSIFTNNYCTSYGGAIAIYDKNNKIINSSFKNNYINGNSTKYGGGAIYSEGYELNINNCTFEDNDAQGALGGAVYLGSYNCVENSIFKNNKAQFGSDIYANSTAIVRYNYVVLAFNETEDEAIYGGSSLTRYNNTFENTKIDSKVEFNTGMVFEYASSGTIRVIVKGGTVSRENIIVLNHPEAKITFVNNVLTVSNLPVGKYTLRVRTTPDENHNPIDKDLPITVNKATAVIKASGITVALKKGTLWTIKLVGSKTGNPISNMQLTLKVYTGSKYKTVTLKTNSKGEASYQTKGLTKGTHKVIVSGTHPSYNFNTLTSTIKVIKPKKLTFKVNKNVAKDGSSLSITTYYKKKPINGVQLKLNVYNGKKLSKTVTLKSKTKGKYKGVAGWGTNKITVGTHKIVLMPANIKYTGSKNIKLKLKKSAKKYVAWETII